MKLEDLKRAVNGLLEFNLTGLTQVTTYAFTIQTYHYGKNETWGQNPENDGAISSVKTFKTDLFVPSRVKNFKVTEKSSSSIKIEWNVEESEADSIAFFYLDILAYPYNKTMIDKRDFCVNPIDSNDFRDSTVYYEVVDYDDVSDNDQNHSCCEKCCAYSEERKKTSTKTVNEFEDSLVKFSEKVSNENFEESYAIKKLKNFVDRQEIKSKSRSHTISNLNSTTSYMLFIHACRAVSKCSGYSLVFEITEKNTLDLYDKVQLRPASYVFESQHFHVYFDEPNLVNGVILKYETEVLEILGNSTTFFQSDCITRKEHEKNEFK